jgi:hypothetical protein
MDVGLVIYMLMVWEVLWNVYMWMAIVLMMAGVICILYWMELVSRG